MNDSIHPVLYTQVNKIYVSTVYRSVVNTVINACKQMGMPCNLKILIDGQHCKVVM